MRTAQGPQQTDRNLRRVRYPFFQYAPHACSAWSRPQPLAGAFLPSFTSSASQNWRNVVALPEYGWSDCQSHRLLRTVPLHQLCPRPTQAGEQELTRAGNVIEMLNSLHAERGLDRLFRAVAPGRKRGVNVVDYALDIRRAVLGHVLADGLEVAPEVPRKVSVGNS